MMEDGASGGRRRGETRRFRGIGGRERGWIVAGASRQRSSIEDREKRERTIR